ncbi:phage tail tube protein [Nocardia pseudobrasiliensis]|uniref:Major tail protein n=1 Tax=Nocardia pseudobrasiliensis TaxID=45979 RepID=A0A370I6N4_9NOCA|nr:hypothetical protein [Nocardia pseudobrasiliensis]RDI65761.1 hypothetical protein DFR76_10576 [Nocardia pseudobrasiliensis]
MVDTAALRNLQQSLIRKPLAGAVLLAPLSTNLPAAFTAGETADLIDLKTTGFTSLGHVAKDGAPAFTPETETSEVESWGLLESARTDITKRNTKITWTGQETHKANLELYHNRDLSTVTYDKVTGETSFADPTEPSLMYHRALFVGIDGAGADTIYVIKVVPKLTIVEVAEQSWKQDEALSYQFTARAKLDDKLGYAIKTVFGGPGWKKIAAAAGFSASV